MKILLVAATSLEVKPLIAKLDRVDDHHYKCGAINIELLISGVGMLSTSYALSKKLSQDPYDLILNIGICGAFDRSIEISEVVWVQSDVAIEEGAESGDHWLSLSDMKLRDPDQAPFQDNRIPAPISEAIRSSLSPRAVNAISVNRVLGNEASIAKMQAYAHPDVESMEGAAVYFVAAKEKVNCIQLRAVSNYVENRDRAAWKVEEALANLAVTTVKFIKNVKA